MQRSSPSLSSLHWPLLLLLLVISGLGIYNIHSAAAHNPNTYLSQFYWLLIGLSLGSILLFTDYRITANFAYIAYGVVCILLIAVLVQGHSAGGAQRWLRIGPLNLQPSELAKLVTVLCLARYFSTRTRDRGYSIRLLFRPLNPSRPLSLWLVIAFTWNRPWMQDPIGEIARWIHFNYPIVPHLEQLLWFKLTLVLLIIITALLLSWWILIAEKRNALLAPWPPRRKHQLLLGIFSLTLIVFSLLVGVWEQPWISDPIGLMLKTLHVGAQSGHSYALLSPSHTFPLLLAALAMLYTISSYYYLRRSSPTFTDGVVAPIDLLAIPALLILVEPDLGTAGVVILVGFSMILIVGIQFRSLMILSCMGLLSATLGWFGILKDYQKRRILTFMDPEQDIQGAGWNAVQSLIAVGSGEVWGKGHREGTQTQLSFLPEQHTDFAFSVWAEEQGFIGASLLILLYVTLLVMALRVAVHARETYGSLIAVGVAAIIFWQAVINIGMVTGVAPVVGLTLPLFSYGGSSMLTVVLGIALLINVHWRQREF